MKSYRLKTPAIAFILILLSNTVFAAEKQWYVAVYGENHEQVTAASSGQEMAAGTFLADDFVGKHIYVRITEGYNLEQYRPKKASQNASSTSASDSISAASEASGAQTEDTTPQGAFTLIDSGLTSFLDGDFKGWYCDKLKVTPLGKQDYQLSCENDMSRQ